MTSKTEEKIMEITDDIKYKISNLTILIDQQLIEEVEKAIKERGISIIKKIERHIATTIWYKVEDDRRKYDVIRVDELDILIQQIISELEGEK
jgi:hypothetical protein